MASVGKGLKIVVGMNKSVPCERWGWETVDD